MNTVPMKPHLVLVMLNKSLYIHIIRDLFYTAAEYWAEKAQNDLPLLRRFNEQFILKGWSVILEFNYLDINGIHIHQIKGTAVRTKFVVIDSNLVVECKEVKMFALLSQLYPQDFC